MTKSTELAVKSRKDLTVENAEWGSIFASLPPVDKFDFKKDELATELAALMSFSGRNRTSMAESLAWKKSRVSKVLSGKGNSTIRTIWEFCGDLGYECHVVFRKKTEKRPLQPWQIASQSLVSVKELGNVEHPVTIAIQDRNSVSIDLLSGRGASWYFSLVANTTNVPANPEVQWSTFENSVVKKIPLSMNEERVKVKAFPSPSSNYSHIFNHDTK